ncbi:MAG: RNA polymerase sigma factor [Candidatus Poribacteria bacterium]|nr:MAG: RNA polymerase sigma factor [Candidatus Poribacteria bacterium]
MAKSVSEALDRGEAVAVDRQEAGWRSASSYDEAPDEALIQAAQRGDTRAFDALVRRYKARVYALAYHQTRNREDALDITQEAFVRAYLALPSWKPRARWYTWLYKITRNLCIDHHRARSRRRTESLDEPESSLPEPTTSDLVSDPERMSQESELGAIIREALASLSERQRDVFVLHHYGGMQVKEVAETLNIAEGTAKIHLFRAVAKLRDLLGPMRERNDI